ncbi:MAG TPA: protein kinase [Methanoregulaceae archaeon]|nr:protein kinase [Methanoregulaceae archaeon]
MAALIFGIAVVGPVSAFTITVYAGPGGTINPGTVSVDPGNSQTFIISANSGYHIETMVVDGTTRQETGTSDSKTFPNVNADHTLSATFALDTGTLDVKSTPRQAEIFIDGTDTGFQTPQILDVAGGSHTLRLSLDGYQDYTTTVSITAGQTTTISQQLFQATPVPTTSPTTVPTTTVKTTAPTPTPTKTITATPTATVTTVHTTATTTTATTTIPTTSPIATITTSVQPQTEVTTQPTTYQIEILPTPTERTPLPTTVPITTGTTQATAVPTLTTTPGETQVVNNSSVIAQVPTFVATTPPSVAPTNNTSMIPVGPQIPPYFTPSNIAWFLLIMVIPLGLLLSHDYMGLGYLSFPQAPLVRAAVALGQGVCVFGLFYIQRSLMDLIPGLGDPTLLPLVLIIMLFVAYLTFSAIALAVGSVLSRPLRWTLKVHVIIGVVVLILAPLILFWLTDGNWRIILASIIVAPITAMLALWQNHSLTMHFRKGGYPWEGFLDREETTVPALTDTHFRTVVSRPDSFPPELADRYTSIEFLGKGGLAHVYRARRLKDGKTVAVKIPIRFDETTGKCFMKEIVAWEGLRHPNIVEITEVNILPLPYVEMEYVRSGLADLKTPLRPRKAVEIIMGVAKGLAYAHEQGIIHRDIKPHNILITKEGVPKITDWGMSRLMGSSAAPTVTGFSLAYASPEQVSPGRFGETDERTDIYQLGVVFYELVTGKPLFPGDNLPEVSNAVLSQAPLPPSQINPRLKDLEPIILKCLEKEQKDRYQTVHELIDALTDYVKREYPPVPEEEREHSGEGEF